MNQTTRQALAIAVTILVLIGIGAASGQYARTLPTRSPQATTQTPAVVKPISYKGEEGKTVLELLKQDHQVTTQDSSFGTFVTAIDGTTSQENTAWLYYIDGKLGQEAADKALTNGTQTIEWRYETF